MPTPFTAEGPQPLLREITRARPYPVKALGALREAVEAVQGKTQAPMALPAASALAVASLAVQGFVDAQTLEKPRPASLYVLTVAESGERKSACDNALTAGLTAHEIDREKVRADAMSRWQNKLALWKGERSRILSEAKASGEARAAEADLEALGKEPPVPPEEGRRVQAPTEAGLMRQLREGLPSLGVFSNEGGRFFGGHAMREESKTATLAALNSLWDDGSITRTLGGEGCSRLYNRRIALHMMVQPVVLRNFMADGLGAGTGFLPRCLLAEPESTIGFRLTTTARDNPGPVDAFNARLLELVKRPLPIDEGTGGLKPQLLRLSGEALKVLEAYFDHVEVRERPGGEYAHITGTASKIAENAARIAAVLTAWDDLFAPEVTGETMAGAVDIADWHLSEALRLSDAATVSAEIDRAERLRKWLVGEWPHHEITPREVVQSAPIRALRESPAARSALAILERHGWIIRLPAQAVVRGAARKEAFQIVRHGNGV